MPFRTIVLMVALSIAVAFNIANILRTKNWSRYARNDGVREMARFFTFAELCYPNDLVPFGDVRAIRNNAIRLGYNPLNSGMVEEAAHLSMQIKKDEAATICGEYQAHIDKMLFAYGYKTGS